MMSSAPPHLILVLVCAPTLKSVLAPLIAIEPTMLILLEVEVITTTNERWTHLVLFLAGTDVLIRSGP